MTARVAGHALQHNGRPVLSSECGCGTPRMHLERNCYDMYGHALCECGALSRCESSNADRQRWHQQQHTTDITSQLDNTPSS